MCVASGLGMRIDLEHQLDAFDSPFGYAIEFIPEHHKELAAMFDDGSFDCCGTVTSDPNLQLLGETIPVDTMTKAWSGSLDW